jgi:hypothetical protein
VQRMVAARAEHDKADPDEQRGGEVGDR